MPNPRLRPEAVEIIRSLLVMGRDTSGQRWTSRRIAAGLGVTDRCVRAYRRRILDSARAVADARADAEAGMAEARSLIGLDE